MLNPFFLNGSKSEQGLIQDLINESIRMYGIDVYYIPRHYIKTNTIIEEVVQSEFNNAYPIEAYVETYDGYDGAGTLLSKFGIQEMDDLVITISKERFENYISPLIQNLPNIKLSTRPKEGDLIYFPLGDRIFEIKYVEHEKPFYQLQKNYMYELRCELFRYGDEVIDTNIEEIDDNTKEIGYIQTLKMVSVGTTAHATALIGNGVVRYVDVTNRGESYKSTPNVVFSSQVGATKATGISTMISGLVDFCETNTNLYRVQGVEIIDGGENYSRAPKVSFVGGDGSGAEAVSLIGNGSIRKINVTNGGSGYTTVPQITFVGVGSTAAIARAIVEDGVVTAIRIIDGAYGFASAPTITIQSPSASGIGTYYFNEVIVGSASSVTARVKSWNKVTGFLEVSNITGEFAEGETLTGQESGAIYKILEVNTDNLDDPNDDYNSDDGFAQNEQIETEADGIIDFSERNPFGSP